MGADSTINQVSVYTLQLLLSVVFLSLLTSL